MVPTTPLQTAIPTPSAETEPGRAGDRIVRAFPPLRDNTATSDWLAHPDSSYHCELEPRTSTNHDQLGPEQRTNTGRAEVLATVLQELDHNFMRDDERDSETDDRPSLGRRPVRDHSDSWPGTDLNGPSRSLETDAVDKIFADLDAV